MQVLSSVAELAGHEDAGVPVVIVALADDHELIEQACRRAGVTSAVAAQVPWDSVRPGAFTVDDVCVISLAVARPDASLTPVRALLGANVVLLVGAESDVLQAVLTDVAARDSPGDGVVALLLGVARISEDNLAALVLQMQQRADVRPARLTRAERGQALSVRRKLLAVEGVFGVQRRMIDDDADIADVTGESSSRRLAAARNRFAFVSETASRLYAAAGDELSQQSTLVTEQLTVVNTVFLPLTLGASFFGMNFGWLTTHIGSPTAFVLLGLVVPALLAVGTVLATRWLQRVDS